MSGNRRRKKNVLQQYQYQYDGHLVSRREDVITRMLVDVGIHYASTLGVAKTAAFLRQKNVSELVITRVLHRPQKCRRT